MRRDVYSFEPMLIAPAIRNAAVLARRMAALLLVAAGTATAATDASVVASAAPPSPLSVAATTQAPLTDAQKRAVLAQIDAVGRRGCLYEVSRPDADGEAGK